MNPLSDRILEILPNSAEGISLKAASDILGEGKSFVSAAFSKLANEQWATIVRRGKGRSGTIYLVSNCAGVTACAVCQKEFQRAQRSKRVTCSKRCQCALGWSNPEKAEKRKKSISAAHSTPEALERLAVHNARRWSDPAQKEALRLQNKHRWQDEVYKAELSAKIRLEHGTPEKRKFYSDMRKAHWADPEKRKLMYEAANKSKKTKAYRKNLSIKAIERNKSAEFRANLSERNRVRAQDPKYKKIASDRFKALWADPEWREKQLEKLRSRERHRRAVETRSERGWLKKNRVVSAENPAEGMNPK